MFDAIKSDSPHIHDRKHPSLTSRYRDSDSETHPTSDQTASQQAASASNFVSYTYHSSSEVNTPLGSEFDGAQTTLTTDTRIVPTTRRRPKRRISPSYSNRSFCRQLVDTHPRISIRSFTPFGSPP